MSNTALIRKLVEDFKWIDEYINTYCILIYPKKTLSAVTPEEAIRGKIKEALTEAQAWLERQGKCGEGWKLIETAPRNTAVLVWNGDVHFAYFEQTKYTLSTGWFILNNGDYHDGWYGRDYKMGEDSDFPLPTHWMPLPKPPTTSQQEARGE